MNRICVPVSLCTGALVCKCTCVSLCSCTGVRVYWWTAVLVCLCTGVLVYQSTGVQVHRCTRLFEQGDGDRGVGLKFPRGHLVYRCTLCTFVPVYRHTGVPCVLAYWCTNVPHARAILHAQLCMRVRARVRITRARRGYRCIAILVYRCTGVLMYRCISVLVNGCTCIHCRV